MDAEKKIALSAMDVAWYLTQKLYVRNGRSHRPQTDLTLSRQFTLRAQRWSCHAPASSNLAGRPPHGYHKPAKKGGMSAAGRARIAAAAKLRWAKVRAAKTKPAAVKTAVKAVAKAIVTTKPAKKKFTMSAAAKAKLSALAKARWAAKKAAQAK